MRGATVLAAILPYHPRCAIDAITAKLIRELIKHSLAWVTGLLHKREVMPDTVNMVKVMAMEILGTRKKQILLFLFVYFVLFLLNGYVVF